jgi:TPR repeat protein
MRRLQSLRDRCLAVIGHPAALAAAAERLTVRGAHAEAAPLLARAARAGIPAAQRRLGRAYLFGEGLPSSPAEALRWLSRAAVKGDTEARTLLATLALQGLSDERTPGVFDTAITMGGAAPDYVRAAFWAHQAGQGGSAEAMAILAHVKSAGPAALRDPEAARYLYRRSAELGWPRGQLGHALALMERGGPSTAAQTLLHAAADAGLPSAHYMLGILAETGAAGAPDFATAARHFGAGAALDHPPSQQRHGLCLLLGRGVPADPFKGESWLRRAAVAGEPLAAALLGDLYIRDGALPPNPVEAATWFRRAAEAGHGGAARALGQMFLTGAGMSPDPREAAQWLRTAVDHGEPAAWDDLHRLRDARQLTGPDLDGTVAWCLARANAGEPAASYAIGRFMAEGIGIPRDDRGALLWFLRAADQVTEALFWCGRILIEGHGVPSNPDLARACYLKAANRGDHVAAAAAGEMMVNGKGGAADPVRARELFSRAAAGGHPGAIYALGILAAGGHGTPPDQAAAIAYFRHAAVLGHPAAGLMLNRLMPVAA